MAGYSPASVQSNLLQIPEGWTNSNIPSTSGTKQGGPEGPVLFSLLFYVCMRDFMEIARALDIDFFTYRYRSNSHAILAADRDPRNTLKGEHTLSWCGYAGDLVLLTKSQNSLNTATSELSRTFGQYSLMVNPTKTETMISNFQFLLDSNPKQPLLPQRCRLHLHPTQVP